MAGHCVRLSAGRALRLRLSICRRAQHLTCIVRRAALEAAIGAASADGSIDGVSMRRLLEPLGLADVAVPHEATMDVDTWADADAVGATGGEGR